MNNWYVITGAPCAGKTTLINQLEKLGYKVTHETARLYIDQEKEKGKTIEEIKKDNLLFQKRILEMKIEIEKFLLKDEVVFLDRGIPDSWAYYKLIGKENDKFLKEALENLYYKKVFLLDFFDIQKDSIRTETRKEQEKIHRLIKEIYLKLGFSIVYVPKMDLKDRTSFILKELQSK